MNKNNLTILNLSILCNVLWVLIAYTLFGANGILGGFVGALGIILFFMLAKMNDKVWQNGNNE